MQSKIQQQKTTANKKALIEALKKTMFNVTEACELVGIERTSYYRWLKEDHEFALKSEELEEGIIDFAETALKKRIDKGDTTAIIFFLKTKGKKRGYVEKQEIDLNDSRDKGADIYEGLSDGALEEIARGRIKSN